MDMQETFGRIVNKFFAGLVVGIVTLGGRDGGIGSR